MPCNVSLNVHSSAVAGLAQAQQQRGQDDALPAFRTSGSVSAPVLFLDFDGVTHPESCWNDQYFCHVDKIAGVLDLYPQVDVVISSSWRIHYPLDELKGFVSAIAPHRIIGVTPNIKTPSDDWLPGAFSLSERQWEIETWLKAHRPWGTPWIAIDDRAVWFDEGCRNLLLTERTTGFTKADAERLQTMIEERL